MGIQKAQPNCDLILPHLVARIVGGPDESHKSTKSGESSSMKKSQKISSAQFVHKGFNLLL